MTPVRDDRVGWPRGPWARRDVVKLGGTLGVASFGTVARAVPRSSYRTRGSGRTSTQSALDPAVVIDGTDVRALALRALDAAQAAGATYADVRLTRQLQQQIGTLERLGWGTDAGFFHEDETLGVGVRVRVGSAWGFAASPYWDTAEVVALAWEAVREAKANARGALSTPEWAPIPIAGGHWATPIIVDPFVVPLEERLDCLHAWATVAARRRGGGGGWSGIGFTREERAVATSEGSCCTQTLYTSGGDFHFTRRPFIKNEGTQNAAFARGLERTAAGWELITEADIPGQLPRLWEEADPRFLPPPVKSGEIGRYDVVFDARSMGALLEQTLGVATQLDRALGYEADSGGVLFLGGDPLDLVGGAPSAAATSYLGPDPLALLGNYQAASPLVTVTATRSLPRGVATVRWDDEGVTPEPFALVKDGVLVDYQTTRALAPVLAPWYQQQGRPVRSHGCAAAQDATGVTRQQMPNLVLEPGQERVSFEDLVADTKRGLAVLGIAVRTDSQAYMGEGYEPDLTHTHVREIVNGKLGARLEGLSFLFSSPNLWKNVVAFGGPGSVVQYVSGQSKGEPAQYTEYSVQAVPAKVTNVDFIDPTRKA